MSLDKKVIGTQNAKIIADLTEAGAQKYLNLIEAGTMTPAVAWAAYRGATRKERERQEEERKGRADLYGGMARAVMVLSGYGGYDDVPKLMSKYDEGELRPPQLGEYLELQHLLDAERFVTQLVKWRKS